MALLLLFPRSFMALIVIAWAEISSSALRILVRVTFEVRGRENLVDGPAIYAAKHQSAWDTFAYFLILKNPSYILKKELLLIPFWGWCARRYGAVIVNRQGGAPALKKMVSDVKDRINRKMPIIIFPEGTRSRPGQTGLYHPGVAALYQATNVSIIPVAVNSGMFWGRRSFMKYPGKIVIEFMPPISSGLPRKEFMKRLHISVEGATDDLVKEAVIQFQKEGLTSHEAL